MLIKILMLEGILQMSSIIFVGGFAYSVKQHRNSYSSDFFSKNIIEKISNPVLLLNSELKISNLNSSAVELFGYKKNIIKNNPFFSLIDKSDKDSKDIAGKIKEKDYVNKKVSFRNNQNQSFSTIISTIKINTDNFLNHTICVLNEISPLLIYDLRINESELRYRLLADNISDIIWIINIQNMKFEYSSPSLNKILGYSIEEKKKLQIEEILTPESLKTAKKMIDKELIKIRNNANDAEKSVKLELDHFTKDGEIIPAEINAKIILDGGKPAKIIGTTREISERKIFENKLKNINERYNSLFDRSMDMIYMFDFSGNFIDANESALKILQYTLSDIKKMNLMNLLHETDRSSFQDEINKIINNAGSLHSREYKIKTASDNYIDVEVTESLVYQNKIPIMIQCIARDITERKNTELQFLAIKKTSEKATKSKNDFIANVSHEIRTPLNSILGFTDILLKTEQDIKKKEKLGIISESGNHLLNLINQILDFSKIESDKFELQNSIFSINDLLEQIYRMFSLKAIEKKISLSIEVEKSVPKMMFGDEYRIRQIIINLVGNAVKFTSEGYVRLLCRYKKKSIFIKIKDTGIGIESENFQKIFSAFSQGDNSISRVFGGSGLGLAITKRILDKINGEISFESKPGRGSTFNVMIPIQNVTMEDEPVKKDIENEELDSLKNNDYKILVLEEKLKDKKQISFLLNELDYDIIFSSSINDLLYIVDKEMIDLIIIDLEICAYNPYQAINLLQTDFWASRIPLLVASDMDELNIFMNYGITGYIRKPSKKTILKKTIKTFLEQQGAVRYISIISQAYKTTIDISVKFKKLNYNTFTYNSISKAVTDNKKGKIWDFIVIELLNENDKQEFIQHIANNHLLKDIPIAIITNDNIIINKIQKFDLKKINFFYNERDELIRHVDNILKKDLKHGKEILTKWFEYFKKKSSNTALFFESLKIIPERISNIEDTVNQQDEKRIKFLIHDLKGLTANYGMDTIYNILKITDENLKTNTCEIAKIKDALKSIKKILKTVPHVIHFNKTINIHDVNLTLSKYKILAAEDDIMNRKLLASMFEIYNCELEFSKDGIETLGKIKSGHYDILLMDINMPVMDGLETIKEIRKNTLLKNLPVIAVTANIMNSEITNYYNSGFDDVIGKPINQNLLFKKILKLVTKKTSDPVTSVSENNEIDFSNIDPGQKNKYLGMLKQNKKIFIPEKIKQTAGLISENLKFKGNHIFCNRLIKAAENFDENALSLLINLMENN